MASDGQRQAILALRAWYPLRYEVLPAGDDHAHWLWIDRTADVDELRLQSALVTPELVARIGPVVHGTAPTTSYAALPLGDGRARLVWSQGPLGAEALHTLTLNPDGRPSFSVALNAPGTLPALTQTRDGTIWLYWVHDRAVWRAVLEEATLREVAFVEALPPLPLTERVAALYVAHDAVSTYLFWQIAQARGGSRALLSVTDRATGQHRPAAPLRVGWSEALFETSFNGGAGFVAAAGEPEAVWLRPLNQDTTTLPVAAVWRGTLGVLFFQEGRLAGVLPLLPTGRLFDAPRLSSDRDRHLALAWSQPLTEQAARLSLLTTR